MNNSYSSWLKNDETKEQLNKSRSRQLVTELIENIINYFELL